MKNSPDVWRNLIPKPLLDGHKYNRGHALIYGASELTGATRLTAEACARMGAGLTTVLGPNKQAGLIYRTTLPAHIMVRDDLNWFDDRVTARLYGCGGAPDVDIDGSKNIPTILDAGALDNLPQKSGANYILTPHEGEFSKTFSDIKGDKQEKALKASKQLGAIIVLKGPETSIAHPDGRLYINNHASPYLASAGTGDVLAGMVTGLCAQGMDPFYAACAAVWIHGEAGRRIGPGLVAGDIIETLPSILGTFVKE